MPGGGGALIGGIGSIVGGLASANAAKKGAEAQVEAAREANALQKEIYYNNVDLMKPWHTAGTNALAQMQYELGLTGAPGTMSAANQNGTPMTITQVDKETQTGGQYRNPWQNEFSPGTLAAMGMDVGMGGGWGPGNAPGTETTTTYNVGDQSFDSMKDAQAYVDSQAAAAPPAGSATGESGFTKSPGYQFRYDTGMDAMGDYLASRGMRLGGPAAKAALEYGQNFGSNEYGNWYNRLASMSGTGQTAANTTAGYGQNYANAAGQNLQNAGQARASGYMGQANALNGTMNSLFGIYGGAQAGLFGDNPWSFKMGG